MNLSPFEECNFGNFRYKVPFDVFDSVDNKDNKCFCEQGVNCPPKGLFNASSCTFGKLFSSFLRF